MKRFRIIFVSITIMAILLINLAACNRGEGSRTGSATPQPGAILADNITATYGASEFRVQLTAIADQNTGGSRWPNRGSRFP